MEWERLKEKIYYEDGSLRDIYVHDITRRDWQGWSDFVNSHYTVSFIDHNDDISMDKIDFKKVEEYWENIIDSGVSVSVFVESIIVRSYFFSDEEIENDITPKEIRSLNDHHRLMEYLKGISQALNRKVILCGENDPSGVLISVEYNEVNILPNTF